MSEPESKLKLTDLVIEAVIARRAVTDFEGRWANPRFDHLVRGGGQRWLDGMPLNLYADLEGRARKAAGRAHSHLDALIRRGSR